jgi:DNA-binding transcriptional LysR family regulator
VSQHIRKLEDVFGVRLFERSSTRITPTPAGEAYYVHCLEVLRAHEAAVSAIGRFRGGIAGQISVGLMPTMTRSALAPALARFSAANPNVSISITEAYSGVLTSQVRAGQHDFAIVPALRGARGIRSRPFMSTPEVLVSARGSGLAHMQPVRLAELGAIKVILPGPLNTRRETLTGYFSANGVVVERIMELDAMMGTLDLVSRTDWMTILPGIMMSADIERRGFTVNPLSDPAMSVELVLIEPARSSMSAAASAFLAVLQDEAAQLNAGWGPALADGKPARLRRAGRKD